MKNIIKTQLFYCLFFLCLVAQSCKKENKLTSTYATAYQSQLIKQEAIDKWFDTNPAAQLLSPDWANARQAVIEGKNVVRVPILNVDKTSLLTANSSLTLNGSTGKAATAGTAPFSTGGNINYYSQHPPELFFVQGPNAKQLKSYLLNFVPTDKNKEFGQDGYWTGTLYEWNLEGDTVFVQEMVRNQTTDFYALKQYPPSYQVSQTNTINNAKLSSIWTWLGNQISKFIGWIGSAFGLSVYGYYYYDGHRLSSGWRLNINWGTGGDDGDGGGGGYTGAGTPIYNSYLPGYTPPSYNEPSYDPWTPYPHGGKGAGPSKPTYSSSVYYLMDYLSLTQEEIDFLQSRDDIAFALENYLKTNGETTENIEFANWAKGYLMRNLNIDINAFFATFFPTGPALIADPNADNWTDPDNEVLIDPDQTVYQQYQDSQLWPTVDRVIDYEKFVPIRRRDDDPTKYVNCLVLAKEQLGKVGYTCSGYLPGSQTFSIYTTQGGVNLNETKKAISYMISSLSQKIPVLIGVDNRPGAPLENKDNSTDHFVVVVGMGKDANGKYFQFVDSATDNRSTGASYNNRLYYDSSIGKITGKTSIIQYRNQPGMHDYIITQVRKSIKK